MQTGAKSRTAGNSARQPSPPASEQPHQARGRVFRVQDAFHADLVEALYKTAASTDYDLVLSATTADRPELTAAESLLTDRCEALILISPQMSAAELTTLGQRAPTIVVARRVKSAAVDVVMTADLEVVRTALEHLISLGHRNIAHLDGGSIHGATDRNCARPRR